MLKLVATDLDGTLLHTDGTVTDRTREVIDAVDALGIAVLFVTGRPIRWMERLWHHVGDHGIAICSNGAIVYDVPGRAVTEYRPIPRAVGLEAAELIRTAIPGTTFGLEKTTGFSREPSFRRAVSDAERPDLEVGPLEELFDGSVVKLLARHQELGPETFWDEVEKTVGHAVTTTWSSARPLVEMSAEGVTKATTLELLCAELGIASEEVLAFGDMPNDVAMLQWAGTSYAMANAHSTALAAAGHRAPPNDEDGVASVLERIFLS